MHPYTSIYQLCMQLFEKADQKPHILRTARLESIISSVEVGEALSLFAGSNLHCSTTQTSPPFLCATHRLL